MKMKAFLMFVLLFLCSMGTKAQDLGANYNENIDYPITEIEMLKQSKVTWVRGFVNIPNLFLQNENGKIVGAKENAIRTHIPTLKFIQAKKALGDRVKFILSLKIPFELYTDTVPKVGTKEMEYIFQATEVLLKPMIWRRILKYLSWVTNRNGRMHWIPISVMRTVRIIGHF